MLRTIVIDGKMIDYDINRFEVKTYKDDKFVCKFKYIGKDAKDLIDCSSKFKWLFDKDFEFFINILDVSNLDTKNVISMCYMFSNCEFLQKLDVSHFDTRNVIDMKGMFENCKSLKNLDVSKFDTKNVTNMSGMFCSCEFLYNLDVSNFDTKKVEDMSYMFFLCISLQRLDVSNFDTRNVVDMKMMFENCRCLNKLDVSNFDTRKVKNMYGMFKNCRYLTELNMYHFDTRNVEDMSYMFNECSSLKELDLTSFTFTQKPKVDNMFDYCSCVVYVKDEWSKQYLIKNTGYTNIQVKEKQVNFRQRTNKNIENSNKMTYEVYKIGIQESKMVSCESPKEALYKVFGFNENQVEIIKVDKSTANVCVKGIGNKRNTTNFYLVKQKS